MKDTLKSYHIDKKKFGGILSREYERAFPKSDKNSSKAHSAELLGLSEDIFSNMLNGKNQDCLFERLIKFCIHTKTPILSVIDKVFDGEDVDFADDLAEIFAVPADIAAKYGISVNPAEYPVIDGAVSAKDVLYQETKITAQNPEILGREAQPLYESLGPDVRSFIQEQSQSTNDIHDAYTNHLINQYHDQLQHYERHISMLNKEHESRIEDIKASHNRAVEYLKAENKRLQKWVLRLGVALGIETLAVLFVFVIDSINKNVGWIRSFMPNIGNGFFDSLWS